MSCTNAPVTLLGPQLRTTIWKSSGAPAAIAPSGVSTVFVIERSALGEIGTSTESVWSAGVGSMKVTGIVAVALFLTQLPVAAAAQAVPTALVAMVTLMV